MLRMLLLAAAMVTVSAFGKTRLNPIVCSEDWLPDATSEAWLGDAHSPKNVYLGVQYGGAVLCDRFSSYFVRHRAHLNNADCIVQYSQGPTEIDAEIRASISGQAADRDRAGNRRDVLSLGFGSYDEIINRGERARSACKLILDYVRSHP